MSMETKEFFVFYGEDTTVIKDNIEAFGWNVIKDEPCDKYDYQSSYVRRILTAVRQTDMPNYKELVELENKVNFIKSDLTALKSESALFRNKTDYLFGKSAMVLMLILLLSSLLIVFSTTVIIFLITGLITVTISVVEWAVFVILGGVFVIGVIGIIMSYLFARKMDSNHRKEKSDSINSLFEQMDKLYGTAKTIKK